MCKLLIVSVLQPSEAVITDFCIDMKIDCITLTTTFQNKNPEKETINSFIANILFLFLHL